MANSNRESQNPKDIYAKSKTFDTVVVRLFYIGGGRHFIHRLSLMQKQLLQQNAGPSDSRTHRNGCTSCNGCIHRNGCTSCIDRTSCNG